MKGYTNLEQSKKLAEILPIESADMWFANGIIVVRDSVDEPDDIKGVSPRWSLTALLSILPQVRLAGTSEDSSWYCECVIGNDQWYAGFTDDPIDACYKMIIKLHKFNLL